MELNSSLLVLKILKFKKGSGI